MSEPVDPIGSLIAEHRIIERLLQIIEDLGYRILSGAKPPVGDLNAVLDFVRTFADRCHHGKEENALFPALEGKEGSMADSIKVMLDEHQTGREIVKAMMAAVKKLKGGDDKGYVEFVDASFNYVLLIRGHYTKENVMLFRMAKEVLGDDEIKSLAKECEKIEVELGEGVHEHMIEMVQELEKKYLKVHHHEHH